MRERGGGGGIWGFNNPFCPSCHPVAAAAPRGAPGLVVLPAHASVSLWRAGGAGRPEGSGSSAGARPPAPPAPGELQLPACPSLPPAGGAGSQWAASAGGAAGGTLGVAVVSRWRRRPPGRAEVFTGVGTVSFR